MELKFSRDELRPLIEAVVAELFDRFGHDHNRIAYKEAEAAALLGMKSHVVRDARLRGQISGSKVGRGYVYTRADPLAFVERQKQRRL